MDKPPCFMSSKLDTLRGLQNFVCKKNKEMKQLGLVKKVSTPISWKTGFFTTYISHQKFFTALFCPNTKQTNPEVFSIVNYNIILLTVAVQLLSY